MSETFQFFPVVEFCEALTPSNAPWVSTARKLYGLLPKAFLLASDREHRK
jgi:hypothetical protein